MKITATDPATFPNLPGVAVVIRRRDGRIIATGWTIATTEATHRMWRSVQWYSQRHPPMLLLPWGAVIQIPR